MADKLILKAKRIYLGGYNVSGESNRVELGGPIEEKDSTSFASTAKEAEPGLHSVSGSAGIMLPTDFALEEVLAAIKGTAQAMSFFVEGVDVGDVAFAAYGLSTEHKVGGAVGELLASTFNLASKGTPLLRGQVLEVEAEYTEATAAGNDLEISGGVAAGQRLYGVFHLTELDGITEVVVDLESDVDDTFATPTTRATATLDAIGGVVLSVDGAITDEFFRLAFTPTGAGTFRIAGLLAVIAP